MHDTVYWDVPGSAVGAGGLAQPAFTTGRGSNPPSESTLLCVFSSGGIETQRSSPLLYLRLGRVPAGKRASWTLNAGAVAESNRLAKVPSGGVGGLGVCRKVLLISLSDMTLPYMIGQGLMPNERDAYSIAHHGK